MTINLSTDPKMSGLDMLRLYDCDFANETLSAAGVELGRIKKLELSYSNLDNAPLELIFLALQSPNSEMKELMLPYNSYTRSSIETHLVPALRHPNCNLTELRLGVYESEHKAAANMMEYKFRNRHALFTLLQGQQVKKLYCPLRRLPIDLLKLVGKVLI
ncbi:hypothetical protein BASA81_006466 [Batrachochytrium salamandrivorans]|nr:hypothetical protein BASA81_006466 [Batrachochytrium salamandrivorans]